MAPENDTVQTIHPVLGTFHTVCAEIVGAVVGLDGEMRARLALVGDGGGYTISEVNLPFGEIHVCRVMVVGKYVTLEPEPVPIVLGVAFASLGQVTRLGGFVLVGCQCKSIEG